MNLVRHYQTLGLRPGSSANDVKAAYRKLVRRYHPDINPNKQAVEHFIKINDAYTAISDAKQATSQRFSAHPVSTPSASTPSVSTPSVSVPLQVDFPSLENFTRENLKRQLKKLGIGNFSGSSQRPPSPSGATTARSETVPRNRESGTQRQRRPPSVASAQDREADLKQATYLQLKALLKQQKYPRAIALVEGLAHRMSTDTEISQWQAIVYQRWGRQLIRQGEIQKAQIYLKKALRTDPNNSSLWREVNQDFWQLAGLANPLENPSSPAV